MKTFAKVISMVLAAIMLVSMLAVITPADEGTYRELRVGSNDVKAIGHFDTTCAFDANYNGYAMDLVYDYIIYKDPDTGDFSSNVLTDWYWDDELCGVVLKMRDDVYFSDGDQMTGEDIIYTITRMSQSFMNADMGLIINIPGMYTSEDGFTVYIPFFNPYGPWRNYMAGNTAIHNKSFEEGIGLDKINFDDPAQICGSGPYRVAEYVLDSYTVFEKRDDWWQEGQQKEGTSSFDKIIVTCYSDTTTMMVDYEMGALDVVFGITNTDYDRIAADPSLGAVGLNETNLLAMLDLNTESSPLTDKNLRLALAYGCDWEQICKIAYGSLGTYAQSTLCSTSAAFVSGLNYPYDPEKAQQIVDENNLAGTELTWVATPDTTGVIAEIVQGMMSQYDIKINIDTRDMATAVVYWMYPGATMAQLDGSSFSNLTNDPNQQYRSLMKDSVFPNIAKKDEKLNEMLDQGRFSTDDEARMEIYKDVQQYIYDEVLCIPIAEWYSAYCYNTSVVSYMKPMDLSMPLLRNVIPAE